jgi:hypothetical protein
MTKVVGKRLNEDLELAIENRVNDVAAPAFNEIKAFMRAPQLKK